MPIGKSKREDQVALRTKPIASGGSFLTGGGPHPSSIGSICSFPTWPLQGTLAIELAYNMNATHYE